MESARNLDDVSRASTDASVGTAQAVSDFMDAQRDGLDGVGHWGEVRERWELYHVVREVLQESSAPAPVTSSFSVRMAAALENEPIHQTEQQAAERAQTRTSGFRFWPRLWPALAVTAAVASVIWVAQPMLGGQSPDASMAFVQPEAADLISAAEGQPQAAYVSAHRQIAAPIAVRQVALMPGVD